jgi:methionyl-tRNA formyltransferase
MADQKLKVFFLGSGDIATPSLQALHESRSIELLGVGTQPDKKAGRGNKMTPTPVGVLAEKLGLDPWKISNINNSSYIERLKALMPDFILVVAFGQLLKLDVLNLPKFGCINVHASLLPRYRGASPINTALLNGDQKTGVSIMKMERGLDTGPVYEVFTHKISQDDNAGTLENGLAQLAATNIVDSLHKIYSGSVHAIAQDDKQASHCGKIAKDDALINWDLTSNDIFNRIRAYFPWPGSFTYFSTTKGPKRLTVVKAIPVEHEQQHAQPGTVLNSPKNTFFVACGQNTALEILQLKPEGKNLMNAAEFLCGGQLQAGDIFIENFNTLVT